MLREGLAGNGGLIIRLVWRALKGSVGWMGGRVPGSSGFRSRCDTFSL